MQMIPCIKYVPHSFIVQTVNIMLNKNSLAVKKVRGQSEATMAISNQNL